MLSLYSQPPTPMLELANIVFPGMAVFSFAAIPDYHRFSGLKQYLSIISQFCGTETWLQYGSAGFFVCSLTRLMNHGVRWAVFLSENGSTYKLILALSWIQCLTIVGQRSLFPSWPSAWSQSLLLESVSILSNAFCVPCSPLYPQQQWVRSSSYVKSLWL